MRFGALVFKWRDGLFPIVVLAALAFGLPPLLERDPFGWWPAGTLGVGVLMAVGGQALRLAVIGYAYIVRGGKDGKAYAEELVVEGFFAHARHPLYTGNLMIATGICLMYGSTFTLFFGIPFFLFVYTAMALNEEAFLLGKFGADYEHYMRTVPRFVPNFRGLSDSLQPYRYDWRRALRKDYGQVALTLLAAIGITTWRAHEVGSAAVVVGTAVGAGVVVSYLTVRVLKKRRLLESE